MSRVRWLWEKLKGDLVQVALRGEYRRAGAIAIPGIDGHVVTYSQAHTGPGAINKVPKMRGWLSGNPGAS